MEEDIKALQLKRPHNSGSCLTMEPGDKFGHAIMEAMQRDPGLKRPYWSPIKERGHTSLLRQQCNLKEASILKLVRPQNLQAW